MAIPMSALVSAGASLIPSPTIAVTPCFCSCLITFSLPSGRTPAMTLSTPACAPIACAVLSLSPVSITTLTPIFCSSLTASALSSFITSATAIMPWKTPARLKNSGVFPSPAKRSESAAASSGMEALSRIKGRLPPASSSFRQIPVRPFPGTA